MSAYCDFNPRLFRQFTSMKTKIDPVLADDWVIRPGSYNTNDGFSLRSEKHDQEVADIDLRRFLRFCREQNLTVIGLNLQGTYIIGNDRSVYTTAMYEEWAGKFKKRTANIIEKKDAKVGHEYKTPCGQHLIYLGFRYAANVKTVKNKDYSAYTTVKKVHYAIGTGGYNRVETLTSKLTEDLGQKKTEAQVNKILVEFYNNQQEIICFETTKPAKGVQFGLIEIPFKECKQRALMVESNGMLFGYENGYTLEIEYHENEWERNSSAYSSYSRMQPGHHFYKKYVYDRETLKLDDVKTKDQRGYDYGRGIGKADKLFRIGIVSV